MLWAGGVVASIMVRTMLLRGNAEFFLFVARPCSTGKHLVAVSDISTGSPFVGALYTHRNRQIFPAVEHFLTVRTFSENPLQWTFAASNAKNCGHSAGAIEKPCEIMSDVLLRMLNAKWCYSWSKVIRIVMPKHLQPEKRLKEWFQIRFVHHSMWLRNTSNFSFGFLVVHETETIFFFGWPDAMVLVGFAITAV